MSDLRKEYGVECLQCAVQLQNEMEHLAGLCPHCFEKDVLENKKWFLNNDLTCRIPYEYRIMCPLRFEAVRRVDYKCQEYDVSYLQRVICIDLIVPTGKDDKDELSNMQVLCRECKKKRGSEIWRAGH